MREIRGVIGNAAGWSMPSRRQLSRAHGRAHAGRTEDGDRGDGARDRFGVGDPPRADRPHSTTCSTTGAVVLALVRPVLSSRRGERVAWWGSGPLVANNRIAEGSSAADAAAHVVAGATVAGCSERMRSDFGGTGAASSATYTWRTESREVGR